MSERTRLPVDAVALQTVVPRLLWLRWPLCLAVTPTLFFPFAWALLVWLVLRFFAWLGDPSRAVWAAHPGSLAASDDTLVVELHDRTWRIPRADVLEGWLAPLPDVAETLIILRLRGGRRLVAECSDLAGGRALLRAAGVSVEQRLLEVPLGSLASAGGNGTVMHLLGPVLLGLFMLATAPQVARAVLDSGPSITGLAFAAGYVLACVAAILGLAHYVSPGRAIVGADGVRVTRLLSRKFVPYERLREVDTLHDGVVLDTADGDVALNTRSFVREAPGSRRALAARLQDAILIFHDERLAAVKLELFARKGLRVAAWRDQVRRLSQGGADYRSVVLESDEIARVAEDPSTPAERRIGAVLSLSGRAIDPAIRERLRVAAGASANPRLRIALDRALEGTLEDEDLAWLEVSAAPVAKIASRGVIDAAGELGSAGRVA